MIIQNGYIEVALNENEGEGESTSTPRWGEKIVCNYYLHYSNLISTYRGEDRTFRRYAVLLENESFLDSLDRQLRSRQIRITNMAGEVVGIFFIESIQSLPAVGLTKITTERI